MNDAALPLPLPLPRQRLCFVTGKGGVGKSTCAAAIALAHARRGERVLLCELSARSAAAEFLGCGDQPTSHDAVRPLPGRHPTLWLAQLDAHRCLQEYLVEHLKSERLAKLATDNRVLARLWRAAPSVNEMATLNAVFRHYHATDSDDPTRRRFDRIVVDLPATGHALAMLGVPRGLLAMVRIGSLAQRAEAIDALIADSEHACICIVTLPEELPVNETVQLAHDLRHRLALDASHVLINCVLPEVLEPLELALLERAGHAVSADGPGRRLLDAATWAQTLHANQQYYMADLRARLQAHFVEVGYSDRGGFGVIESVADALAPAPGMG